MQRIAVFASGRGSNFEALVRAEESGLFPGRIVLLLSDQAFAPALEFARKQGIPGFSLDSPRRKGPLTIDEEASALSACREAGVDWVCLAGFMRILGPNLLEAYPGRILNIHPALLPAFSGLDAQRQAFDYGVKVSGCTVHFVDAGVDTGPIVLQRAVELRDGDDAGSLAARILEQEHEVYPEALRLLLKEPWERVGRRIVFHHRKDGP